MQSASNANKQLKKGIVNIVDKLFGIAANEFNEYFLCLTDTKQIDQNVQKPFGNDWAQWEPQQEGQILAILHQIPEG